MNSRTSSSASPPDVPRDADASAPVAVAAVPRVRGLRVRTVLVPMQTPHRTATGIISESPLVLTEVMTDTGVIGCGLVFTYTSAALKPLGLLVQNLEPLVVGEALAPADIAHKLARRFRLLGTQGLVGMALAAIDMALWDALARSHAMSLAALLGGTAKAVPAYGAVGYDGVLGSARSAEDWAKRGFTGVKAKIGYATVQEDVAVVRAMRSAVGDAVAIMVDYNQCLAPADAVQRLRVLDGEGLTWVEEPTLAHDHDGHAHIARAAGTPIQCGENWWGVMDMHYALQGGACDFAMIDVMKIGGVTGWRSAAALAEARNVPVSSHLWPEISAQLLCVTPTAHWLEYVDWWSAILAEPLAIENGHTSIDGVIGTGTAWNEESVHAFAV